MFATLLSGFLSLALPVAKSVLSAKAAGMVASILQPLTGFLTDTQRQKHLERITQMQAEREIRLQQLQTARDVKLAAINASKEIRVVTAGFPEMRILTFLIALPFVIHVNLVGADTNFQLGWGIPAFPHPFDEWEGAIILSFFGVQATVTVARGAVYAASKIFSK